MPYIKVESKGQMTFFPSSLDDYITCDNPVRNNSYYSKGTD